MRTSWEEGTRGPWHTCTPLPGIERVRSPFRRVRRRALGSDVQLRLETIAAALQPLVAGPIFVREWVNPDCRGMPHVTEVFVTANRKRRCLIVPKAADRLDALDLQRLLDESEPRDGLRAPEVRRVLPECGV